MPPSPPRLAIVVAIAANGVIGVDNRLPWRLPGDLRHFRALTTGHAIIMGRRTWESLPGALPDRQNLVLTRQPGYRAAGAEVADSLEAALTRVRLPAPAFCIGGAQIYGEALPRADLLYVTEIAAAIAGDTHFPACDWSQWVEFERAPGSPGDAAGPAYAFVAYRRRA